MRKPYKHVITIEINSAYEGLKNIDYNILEKVQKVIKENGKSPSLEHSCDLYEVKINKKTSCKDTFLDLSSVDTHRMRFIVQEEISMKTNNFSKSEDILVESGEVLIYESSNNRGHIFFKRLKTGETIIAPDSIVQSRHPYDPGLVNLAYLRPEYLG